MGPWTRYDKNPIIKLEGREKYSIGARRRTQSYAESLHSRVCEVFCGVRGLVTALD